MTEHHVVLALKSLIHRTPAPPLMELGRSLSVRDEQHRQPWSSQETLVEARDHWHLGCDQRSSLRRKNTNNVLCNLMRPPAVQLAQRQYIFTLFGYTCSILSAGT